MIKFDDLSIGDPVGRVFRANGKLYRGIHEAYINQVQTLLGSSLFQLLLSKRLIVETKISTDKFTEFPLVLEHKELPQIYHYEWSFSMLKSACQHILAIQEACILYGYTLKDAHLGNILFDGHQATWIDIPSIIPKSNDTWEASREFIYTALLPLVIWAGQDYFLARKLLEVSQFSPRTLPSSRAQDSKSITRWIKIIPHQIKIYVRGKNCLSVKCPQLCGITRIVAFLYGKIKRTLPFRIPSIHYLPSDFSIHLASCIMALPLPKNDSQWAKYGATKLQNDQDIIRFNSIIQAIERLEEIKSITDLAGNSGYLASLIAQKLNVKVLSCDYDSNAINSGYLSFQHPSLHFCLHNFMLPVDTSAGHRLSSDLVLVLAVSHHLILTQGFHLEAILERISKYTRRYVLMEFMPLGLWNGTNEPEVPDWYNIKWFQKSFETFFKLIDIQQLERNRILLIGLKNERND